MKKKFKATAALGVSVLGAIGTAPWTDSSFLGGMVHNGFLAATIGGMADWFAVTALFRKPLGISYKTEILIRNRQRIMQALVDFVAHDLLNTKNIMGFVERQDLSRLLTVYAETKGIEPLAGELEKIVWEVISLADTGLVKEMTPVIRHELRDRMATSCSSAILQGLARKEQAEIISSMLLSIGQQLLESAELRGLLQKNIGQILKRYEGNGMGRAFVMGLIDLNETKMTSVLVEKAREYLHSMEQKYIDEALPTDVDDIANEKLISPIDTFTENPARMRLEQWVYNQLKQLSNSQDVNDALYNSICSFATDERIETMLQQVLSKSLTSEKIKQKIKDFFSILLEEFTENKEWQGFADRKLKGWLESELDRNHHVIVTMIEDRLNELSDEKLVEFAEDKVADDLQMIRINGSVIGSLAGMAIYIVIYLAGQVFRP